MFETLLGLVKDNDAAVAEVKKIQQNYNSLSEEVGTLEGKLQDAIAKRDKYKDFTKEVKGKLGIEEGEELTSETVEAKITGLLGKKESDLSEHEAALKKEIKSLEETLAAQKDEYEGRVSQVNKGVLESKLELELYKTTSGINAVNAKANAIIVEELKKGATFEEGKIVYKDADGTTVRKDGVAMTLADKLETIKASEDFGFLFKADVKSGSGVQTAGTVAAGKTLSKAQQRFLDNARSKGVDLNL